MQQKKDRRKIHYEKTQPKTGLEFKMHKTPLFALPGNPISRKLKRKTAIITGGGSGIGRAVAVSFAMHGEQISLSYLSQVEKDEHVTKRLMMLPRISAKRLVQNNNPISWP